MSLAAEHNNAAGLDLAGLGDLASMLDGPAPSSGAPAQYDLAVIHEDARNSRQADNPGYSESSIAELADSIRRKGLKSPISLRRHPTIPGHFVINHGHRRYRATKVAGLQQIAAFEDPNFDDADQVIENIQRENLTAREIADYLGRKLSEGTTQAALAHMLGKSKAWVSQHVRMLDLPDPVAVAVAKGQVTDVTLASELASAHREDPEAVQAVLATGAKPTRAVVKAIRKAAPAPSASEQTAPTRPRTEQSEAAEAAIANMRETRTRDLAERPAILKAGEAALRRLLPIALGDTGQSGVVARFLLNLYNGNRFPFDNTDLRRLDQQVSEDCIAVLRMDSLPAQEVHTYFSNGSQIWEKMASDWGFRDFQGEKSWRSSKTNV